MTLKKQVDATGIHPVLWIFLGAIALRHKRATGKPMVVTSLRRKRGRRPSKHSPPKGELVRAGDLRRWYFRDAQSAEEFCKDLQRDYGSQLGVVLEPEWLTPKQIAQRGGIKKIAPHIHVQLKKTDWPAAL